MSIAAATPVPPYYAVIFTSQRTEQDNGYQAAAKKLAELAGKQTGFLGAESVRNENGVGITVSYWKTLEDIENWKNQMDHVAAKSQVHAWYTAFGLRVCKVERDLFF